MAVKWETVKAGDTLYDVHKTAMGNTTMKRMGCWEVEIISIDHAAGVAVARWNGNRPETWARRRVERLRRHKPVLKDRL
jgi:hypothetical protein